MALYDPTSVVGARIALELLQEQVRKPHPRIPDVVSSDSEGRRRIEKCYWWSSGLRDATVYLAVQWGLALPAEDGVGGARRTAAYFLSEIGNPPEIDDGAILAEAHEVSVDMTERQRRYHGDRCTPGRLAQEWPKVKSALEAELASQWTRAREFADRAVALLDRWDTTHAPRIEVVAGVGGAWEARVNGSETGSPLSESSRQFLQLLVDDLARPGGPKGTRRDKNYRRRLLESVPVLRDYIHPHPDGATRAGHVLDRKLAGRIKLSPA